MTICEPTPRTLHLLDVENLAGGTDASEVDLMGWLPEYRVAADWATEDLACAACSNFVFRAVAFDLPEGIERIAAGGGADAADLAIIDRHPAPWMADRFTRVVIGSGDGIFADLARQLRYLDTEVWVVSKRRSLSRALALEADEVRFLVGTYDYAA